MMMLQSIKPYFLVAMLYPKMLDCEMQSVEAELMKIAKAQNEEVIVQSPISSAPLVKSKAPAYDYAKAYKAPKLACRSTEMNPYSLV